MKTTPPHPPCAPARMYLACLPRSRPREEKPASSQVVGRAASLTRRLGGPIRMEHGWAHDHCGMAVAGGAWGCPTYHRDCAARPNDLEGQADVYGSVHQAEACHYRDHGAGDDARQVALGLFHVAQHEADLLRVTLSEWCHHAVFVRRRSTRAAQGILGPRANPFSGRVG